MGIDSSTPASLLYLVIYTLAAAGILFPLLLARRKGNKRLNAAGRFLQALSVTAIIPSLQVILGAFGILKGLPGLWPEVVTVLFNVLILFCLYLSTIMWSRLVSVFSPAAFFTDSADKPVFYITLSLLFLSIISQFLLLFSDSHWTIQVAQFGLLPLFVLLAAIFISASVRLYRSRQPLLSLIPPAFLFMVLFDSVLDYPMNQIIPSLLLILLYGLALAVVIKELRKDDLGPEEKRLRICENAGLTPREQEIAILLSEGHSYKDLSNKLNVSLSTIQSHVGRVYGKMNVNSKTELSRKLND